MNKPRVAVVRGAFLNNFEMQSYGLLTRRFRITAFASVKPLHEQFPFPVVKLASPMDLPPFPYKMQILNRLFGDAHYLIGLERRLRGFDIVHTAETYYHFTKQSLDAKRRGWVNKVVSSVWETIPSNNESIWGKRKFKKRALREIDHFLAVTCKAKNALIFEGVNPTRISVLGAYVDTKRFYPGVHWQTRSGDTQTKPLTILFVGRMEEEKGVLDLLNAISLLSRDRESTKRRIIWEFVGTGSKKREVSERLDNLPTNWQLTIGSAGYDQMPEIYRRADIFVAPSKSRVYRGKWEEQYGMALLEAQASGLPIVTTLSGGILENVGDSAKLVSPGDVRAITEAIKGYVVSPAKRYAFGKRARHRALTVHDVAIGARKLTAIYGSVLKADKMVQ